MTSIPYTVERRPDTGVNNVQLGMWLFIASEVMLFGGLFSAYFMLRAGAPSPWLPLREHVVSALGGTFNLLLATSSFALARLGGRETLNLARVRLGFAMSLLFALVFCTAKWADYLHLFAAGRRPSSSTQMATFFLLTGIHLFHVIGGMIATTWLALTPRATWESAPGIVINRMHAVALYWYFVDAVWLVIFGLLYVF
jgi:heme/copper-type cytochrome/quinol oxidase subunit 3